MTNGKKQRQMNYLSLGERIAVIHEYERIQSVSYLARKFNCGMKQIRNIIRRREEYLQDYENSPDDSRMPSRRPSRVKAVNIVLCEWLRRCNGYEVEINDGMIRAQGAKIAQRLGISEYRADKRWIERFKQKFHLTYMNYDAQQDIQALDVEDIIEDLREDIELAMDRKAVNGGGNQNSDNNDTSKTQSPSATEYSFEPIDETYYVRDKNHIADTSSVLPPKKRKLSASTFAYVLQQSHHTPYVANDDHMTSDQSEATFNSESAKSLENYKEALKYIKPLEEFVFAHENIRAIGLLNQIENIFKDEIQKEFSSF